MLRSGYITLSVFRPWSFKYLTPSSTLSCSWKSPSFHSLPLVCFCIEEERSRTRENGELSLWESGHVPSELAGKSSTAFNLANRNALSSARIGTRGGGRNVSSFYCENRAQLFIAESILFCSRGLLPSDSVFSKICIPDLLALAHVKEVGGDKRWPEKARKGKSSQSSLSCSRRTAKVTSIVHYDFLLGIPWHFNHMVITSNAAFSCTGWHITLVQTSRWQEKTKVTYRPHTKTDLLFCCQRDVWNNLNGHPVHDVFMYKSENTECTTHTNVNVMSIKQPIYCKEWLGNTQGILIPWYSQ